MVLDAVAAHGFPAQELRFVHVVVPGLVGLPGREKRDIHALLPAEVQDRGRLSAGTVVKGPVADLHIGLPGVDHILQLPDLPGVFVPERQDSLREIPEKLRPFQRFREGPLLIGFYGLQLGNTLLQRGPFRPGQGQIGAQLRLMLL